MPFNERLVIDGGTIDPDITDAITSGGVILARSMEGAEALEVTIADTDGDLLVSGALSKRGKPSTWQKELGRAAWDRYGAMRVALDGIWFRFAGVSGKYDAQPWTITLIFEAELATLMRQRDEPVKWSRGQGSRGLFIVHLGRLSQLKDLSDRGIITFAIRTPDPFAPQEIAQPDDDDHEKGLSANARITINGGQVGAEQRRNLETSLTEAESENATERVFLAMLVAGIGESGFLSIMNRAGSKYGGVFQGNVGDGVFTVNDTKAQAHYFLVGGKGFQGGGAIKLARENPDWTPGKIALTVEGSRANFSSDAEAEGHYQQHVREAEQILEAWGGAAKSYTVRESFEFRAGERDESTGRRENYWDASGRLADARRWRRFATRNVLWVGPDEWFFKNRPAFVVDGEKRGGKSRAALLSEQGVHGLTFDADVGMPTSEVRLRVLAPRWTAGPGSTFEWANMGPLDGRWLIWSNRLDVTQSVEIADIVLRRPAPEKKEPAPGTRTRTETAPETGSARERIVAAAEKALEKRAQYRYEQIRPMPDHLIPVSPEILYIDCSAFTTLVYKHAGVVDPNGRDYAIVTGGGKYPRGHSGFTGTLAANGRRTSTPQPGDMCFYGSGPPFHHVNLYVGDGQCINMGPSAGLSKGPVRSYGLSASDFAGYYTFDLSDA